MRRMGVVLATGEDHRRALGKLFPLAVLRGVSTRLLAANADSSRGSEDPSSLQG